MIRAEFDPRLVEETVLLQIERAPIEVRREFRRERDSVYEEPDPEKRHRGFVALSERWFTRLHLGAPVFVALRDAALETALSPSGVGAALSSIGQGWGPVALKEMTPHATNRSTVSGIAVVYALSAKDEGADLHASSHAARLVIRLRPTTLVSPEATLALLRGELLHVADMLDPRFAYDPRPFPSGASGAADEFRKARYRALWQTTVDGRLVSRGWLSPDAVGSHRSEFLTVFPNGEELFQAMLQGPRPSHEELWKEALRPLPGSSSSWG